MPTSPNTQQVRNQSAHRSARGSLSMQAAQLLPPTQSVLERLILLLLSLAALLPRQKTTHFPKSSTTPTTFSIATWDTDHEVVPYSPYYILFILSFLIASSAFGPKRCTLHLVSQHRALLPAASPNFMEPLDEETKQWLAKNARTAEAKRTEYFENESAITATRKLADARRFLGKMPPSLSSSARNFVSIFRAPEAELDDSAMIVEGVVFDVYGVMCGHMDGSGDFTAFALITAGEEISSWRQNYPQIEGGSRVRIKFIDKENCGLTGDHIDVEVLEVWIDQTETAT